MSTYEPSEEQIQTALRDYMQFAHPLLFALFIHIPNEGKRSLREGAKQKRLGLVRGVSDIFFAYPSGGYHGLWLEIKKAKGRLTIWQKLFLQRMSDVDYKTAIAYSLDEAIQVMEGYINAKTEIRSDRANQQLK